jgi:hypothetical protein
MKKLDLLVSQLEALDKEQQNDICGGIVTTDLALADNDNSPQPNTGICINIMHCINVFC